MILNCSLVIPARFCFKESKRNYEIKELFLFETAGLDCIVRGYGIFIRHFGFCFPARYATIDNKKYLLVWRSVPVIDRTIIIIIIYTVIKVTHLYPETAQHRWSDMYWRGAGNPARLPSHDPVLFLYSGQGAGRRHGFLRRRFRLYTAFIL